MSIARSIAWAGVAALALAGSTAFAQARQAQARMGASVEPPGCEKAVKDYVNALRFIKEASGTGIATRVEHTYLNEADLAQMVAQQGYCGAAQALKNKGVAMR